MLVKENKVMITVRAVARNNSLRAADDKMKLIKDHGHQYLLQIRFEGKKYRLVI